MIDLKAVITEYPESVESATRLRAYLADLYPEERARINIITAILDCGIAEEIKRGASDQLTLVAYASRLENGYGYSRKMAEECLHIWCAAYDIPSSLERIQPNALPKVAPAQQNQKSQQIPTGNSALDGSSRHNTHKAGKKQQSILLAICVCIALVILAAKAIIPWNDYNRAITLMNNGEYEAAITAFEAMNGYKDSTAQIAACQTAIKDNNYNAAVALMDAGKYEEAIAAFGAMNGYKDSAAQIEICQTAIKDRDYKAALVLLNDGKIIDAYKSLTALNGYKDSAEKVSEIFDQYKTEKLKIAEVGDIIFFGTYEQDNNTSNGKEDVEWLVLAKENEKALVISKYALDCQQYNSSYTNITWEKCSLRNWLNDTFLNTAFSADEQAKIAATSVSADKNPKRDTYPGNATNDKMFLLSITEAKKYFSSDESRECVATAYTRAQGAYTSNDYLPSNEVTYWWWLRSSGNRQNCAALVRSDGSVDYDGGRVNYGSASYEACDTVRPAMWINLED